MGLAWLGEHGDPTPTLDDAHAHLEALPQRELVELLIDHAHEDEALARKLLLRAARPTSGAAVDVASLRALIEQAFAYRDFVPYREVWGYVRGIEEAIDALEALLEQGRGGDIEGGCTRDLWLKLADLRRTERPDDALGVYRRHVEDVIAGRDKRAYAEAVRLIDETMRALYGSTLRARLDAVSRGRGRSGRACTEAGS